jgi:hypothetical protein
MNPAVLNQRWSELAIPPAGSAFNYIHIDPACIPNLNIGFNEDGNRCVILALPQGYDPSFNPQKRQNITTIYNRQYNLIILELTDKLYSLLFTDLVVSLFFKIKDIADSRNSTDVFKRTIALWSLFLENAPNNSLSEEVVKGLFGEMSILSQLVDHSTINEIDDVLKSWKGPYDTNHDFYLDDKDFEVKTKNLSKTEVRISSEFQLETENGRPLELVVVSVEKDIQQGQTLESLFTQIRDRVIQIGGDITILLLALREKNLSPMNLSDYNCYPFKLVKFEYYECERPSFPRIIRSSLANNLSGIKYNINLNGLNNYIIRQIEF